MRKNTKPFGQTDLGLNNAYTKGEPKMIAIPRNEALRLLALALADKLTGAKVTINTNHSVSADTLMDLLARVHKGTTCITDADLNIVNGEWHFGTN